MSETANIESDPRFDAKPDTGSAGNLEAQTDTALTKAQENTASQAEDHMPIPLASTDGSEATPQTISGQEITIALANLEATLFQGVEKIISKFEEKLAFDKFKEDQITRLHSELQEHKSDLISRSARPLINGIIRIHDDIGRIVEALQKQDQSALTPERFFNVIKGFQQDIEIILGQNGVEAYREDTPTFDPRRQKALTTIPTSDSTKVGLIARRLHPGFEQGNALLQKERVAVYALAAPAPLPAQTAEMLADGSDRLAQGDKQ